MNRGRFLLCSLVVVVAGATFPAATHSQSVAVRVEEAHRLYEEDRLNEAVSAYRELLASGVTNGYLRYNLGNGLFRQGKLGPAILEYERALRYLPRFGDLRHNLEYARGLTVDEVLRPSPPGGAMGFLVRLHGLLNLGESLVCVAGLWWILTVVVISGWFLKCADRLKLVRRVVLGLLVLGLASTGLKVTHARSVREGIVLAPTVEVKTGPGGDYSTTFGIHEGTKVRIEMGRGGWSYIRLPNGFVGWMRIEDLGVI